MDTIVYFYKKRGAEAAEAEPVGLKTYLLIRVGLDVGREEWFGKKLAAKGYPVGGSRAGEDRRRRGSGHSGEVGGSMGGTEAAEAGSRGRRAAAEGGCFGAEVGSEGRMENIEGSRVWGLLRPLRALRQRRKARAEVRREQELEAAREQERERLIAARAQILSEVEMSMGRLAAQIEEFAEGWKDCYFVYEDSVRKSLAAEASPARRGEAPPARRGEAEASPARHAEGGASPDRRGDVGAAEAILPLLWERHFQGKDFRGYAQRFWVEQLLPQAVQPHFVILGMAPCLFEVIEACARRMKSLRWILPEEDCDEELQGFVEDFCTEYGLAIMLEPFGSAAALKRLRLVCGQPVNVLDFTGEAYMAVSDVPKGSVWLDMFSVEEKRRRIAARGGGILYVSLKEKWKTVQKRCVCPIVP